MHSPVLMGNSKFWSTFGGKSQSFGTVLIETPKFWLSFPMFFNHFWMNFDWCILRFWWEIPSFGPVLVAKSQSFGTVLMDTPKFWLSFPMFFNHFWMNVDWCILQFWWEIPSFGPVLVENPKKFWHRFDGNTQVLAQFSHVFQSFLNECWLMHSPVLMGNSKFWSSFGGKFQRSVWSGVDRTIQVLIQL